LSNWIPRESTIGENGTGSALMLSGNASKHPAADEREWTRI
jgi:hypothetical protein